MNNIFLTGRITKDIELKQGGKTQVAKFSLAVTRPFSKDETDFINCVAFGKTAELLSKYVSKGHKLGVVGRLQTSKYEVNGEKRTSYDVVVDTIEFLESKEKKSELAEKVVDTFTKADEDDDTEEKFPF